MILSHPKVAIYSLTRDRLRETQTSFALLKEMAGLPYDHYVLDNGSKDGTNKWLDNQGYHFVHLSPDNKGQCISSNILLDAIRDSKIDYDYIVRFDNDIIPKTDRFIAKTIEAMKKLGTTVCASPDIVGLNHKPRPFGTKELGEFKYNFVEILGGACRVMPASLLLNFRFSVNGPLALGEAKQIAAFLLGSKPPIPMIYYEGATIEHPTDKHVEVNPDYFKRRRFEEFTPYGL